MIKAPRRFRRGMAVLATFSLASNLLQLALPLYSMQVFDRVLASGSEATLAALTAIAVAFVISGTLLDGLRAQMLVRLANHLELHWRDPLLQAALRPDGAQPIGAGPLRDLETVRQCVAGSCTAALLDLPWSSLFVVAVFCIAPQLGWLTWAAVAALFVPSILGEFLSARWNREAQAGTAEAQRLLEAALAARETVLAMGIGTALRQRVATLRDHAGWSQSHALERSAWSAATSRGLRNLLQLAIVASGALLVLSGNAPAGVIVASTMLFARALAPIERVASSYRQLRAARAAFLRLVALEEDMRADQDRALTPMALPRLSGRIDVEGLSGGRSPVAGVKLAKVSFSVAAGEVLAVIGPSGAGKSTLARALVGLAAPTAGTVRLDGAAVADWHPDQLGHQVGYLPQEPSLLEGTIAEMIARFGVIDEAKVVAAAREVEAHEIVLRLPNGYQTALGSRSESGLSAGERQRVALAQAFYGDPRLLVLDEPTANLDSDGEAAVVRAILSAKRRGATVIVISKVGRLVAVADQLLLLGKGRVVELKTRAQLDERQHQRLVAAGVRSDGQPRLVS